MAQFRFDGEKGFQIKMVDGILAITYMKKGKIYMRRIENNRLSQEIQIGFGEEFVDLFDGNTVVKKRKQLTIN